MEKKNRISTAYWLLCAVAAVLFGVLSLRTNIWADEAYTFAMVRHSFADIWRITAADVHPPLYYFLVKIFTSPFGYSQYSVRLFSGACYFLILAIGGWQLTRLFDRKTGLLFMLLYMLFPFALDYSTEARMYSSAALAVFLCALFAYRAYFSNKAGDWIAFTAAGLCAAYQHYFALVAAGAIYGVLLVCILVKKRSILKSWLVVSAVTIVLYLPWLKCFAEQLAFKVSNEYWIAPITLASLYEDMLTLLHATGDTPFPIFFALLYFFLLLGIAWRREAAPLLAMTVCLLTEALGVGVSLLIRPVYIIRYLVPCAPLMIFFLAWGLARITREKLYGAAMGFLLAGFGGSLMYTAVNALPPQNMLTDTVLEENSDAQAYVILVDNDSHISQIAAYYNSTTPIYLEETLGAASPFENIFPLSELHTEDLRTILVFTDEGTRPTGSYLTGFAPTLVGTYQGGYNTFDIWKLEKESAPAAETDEAQEAAATPDNGET